MSRVLYIYLRKLKCSTSEKEFKEILKIVNQDIQFNYGSFGRKPSTSDVIRICEIAKVTIRRCEDVSLLQL